MSGLGAKASCLVGLPLAATTTRTAAKIAIRQSPSLPIIVYPHTRGRSPRLLASNYKSYDQCLSLTRAIRPNGPDLPANWGQSDARVELRSLAVPGPPKRIELLTFSLRVRCSTD